MDRVTWLVIIVLLAAVIEVTYPGTIEGLIYQLGSQLGLR